MLLARITRLCKRVKIATLAIAGGLGRNTTATKKVVRAEPKPVSDVLLVGLVGGDGGASVFMQELAFRMMQQGITVKIVVPSSEATSSYRDRCSQRGISVELTDWLTDPSKHSRFFLFRRYLNAIRFVRKFRSPIIHYHLGAVSALPHYLLRAMVVLRMPPVFITAHNNCDDPRPGEPWARYWAAVAPRRLKKVICISKRGLQRQLEYGIAPEQTEYIPNGVELSTFMCGDSSVVRRQLKLPDQSQLIISSSRIESGKRPLDALEAFRAIADEFPETHLVFVGRGSALKSVEEAAKETNLKDRVHLPGFLPNVADWLAASTAWVLPTESEGFSIAVLEAMAAGCAIVTTNCPGNDEIVVDGHNALVTEVGDVMGMAASLRLILSEEDLRVKLQRGARQTSMQYSFERTYEAYLACYSGMPSTQHVEVTVSD